MTNNVIQKILGFKILELPVVPTFIGSFVLMANMFMWYGSYFVDQFHPLMGIVEEDVTAAALGWWYPIGMILSMSQGLGIAILLKWRNWPGYIASVTTAFTAGVFFGAITFSYPLIILPDHNHALFYINASGIITSFAMAAITITFLRKRVSQEVKETAPHRGRLASL